MPEILNHSDTLIAKLLTLLIDHIPLDSWLFAEGCVSTQFPPNACRGERRGDWGAEPLSDCLSLFLSILGCGLIAKRTMRAKCVVFHSPAFQDDPRFSETAKEFSVKALVAQLIMEAFDMAVFPGTAWLDGDRLDVTVTHPILDCIGDELRAIVAAQVFWNSISRMSLA